MQELTHDLFNLVVGGAADAASATGIEPDCEASEPKSGGGSTSGNGASGRW